MYKLTHGFIEVGEAVAVAEKKYKGADVSPPLLCIRVVSNFSGGSPSAL